MGNKAQTKSNLIDITNISNKRKDYYKNGKFTAIPCPCSISLNEQVLISKNTQLPFADFGSVSLAEKFILKTENGELTENFTLEGDLEYLINYEIDGSCLIEFYNGTNMIKNFTF